MAKAKTEAEPKKVTTKLAQTGGYDSDYSANHCDCLFDFIFFDRAAEFTRAALPANYEEQ
jgi:hypothetical protein